MQNDKEKRTAQGLITPGPAAMEGVQAGPQSSKSFYRNTSPVANLAGEVDNVTSTPDGTQLNPFQRSRKGSKSPLYEENTKTEKPKGGNKLEDLRKAEEETFKLLGEKLIAAYNVAYKANNIHKPIRENLNCAFALYQELKDQRRQLNLNENHTEAVKQLKQAETQTDKNRTPDKMEEESQGSESPSNRKRKIAKNPSTMAALQVQSNIAIKETDNRPTNEWKTVQRKENHKKYKRNKKRTSVREQGEALTIKTSASETYADVIKEMKMKINPSDIGVQIKGIRRTKAGEVLVKLRKGEGQAEKLKAAICETLGEELTVKQVTNNQTIDIRDMDETTDEHELLQALVDATKSNDATEFKILNIRESYGRTKQALVRIPGDAARSLLQTKKIKVGWVMCRIRPKAKTIKCFKCFERGHLAKDCKGTDRSDLCRRCCKTGHIAKDCNEQVNCIICTEIGAQNTQHYAGSSLCINNRHESK